MINLPLLNLRKRKRLSSVLGLTLDGSRLEGLVLQRAMGAFHVRHPFSVSLSLDPLTNAPELVGREIRNHLDAAGVRERNCVVGLPLKWVLATHVEVPDLPEADIASFLQIEAERGFPCDMQTLQVITSRCQAPGGKQQALLAGIPKNHLAALDRVLRAAKLRPVSLSLGIAALQPAVAGEASGELALAIGETHVALQVTCGGGVAALRALEGALEIEGAQRVLHADLVAREARITLGQLPAELRQAVRRVRIFGPPNLARQLADEMELRFESMGLEIECVSSYSPNEFGVEVPAGVAVSPAFSLAARLLAGQGTVFEFMPPRVSTWRQMAARYSSGKLRTALTAAGSVAVLVGGLFFYQQWQLWGLESPMGENGPPMEGTPGPAGQHQSIPPLVRRFGQGPLHHAPLSRAFPRDSSVTAKTIEIGDLKTVSCTGVAKTAGALLPDHGTSPRPQTDPRRQSHQNQRAGPGHQLHVHLHLEPREAAMQIKNRQQLLIIVTISAAALFIADKVVLTPLLNAWDARQTRIAELRKKVTQGKALLGRAQGIRNYWREISQRSLTNDTSVAQQRVFQAVTQWAQDSGVSIGSYNPQLKVDSDDYSTYECHIDATGDLGRLTRFLWGAEREPLALRFQSIESERPR